MNLVYFLGRFHVLVLHLPIGILLMAVVMEVLSRRKRFSALEPAVNWAWGLGAVAALVTVILGLMHATEGGFDEGAIALHRNSGVALMVVAFLIAAGRLWVRKAYDKAWIGGGVAVAALLTLTGHAGGNLTHGETFLVEHGPAPLRVLAGLPASSARPKPTALAQADLYLDVVQPALKQRCASCHNDGKRQGELSLASFDAMMKGGENGAVIAPGQPGKSDLYRRITLDRDHDDFMPQDGKTPLNQDQVDAVGFWIAQGARKSSPLASLQVPAQVQPALMRTLGLAPSTAAPGAAEGLQTASADAGPEVPPLDPKVAAEIESRGFVVRPIAQNSGLVDVDFTPNRQLQEADLTVLSKAKSHIRSLNLRAAGVADAHLATIGQFENLVQLRLEGNPITDAGLAGLSGLKSLTAINLTGAKVTRAGLQQLAALPRLQRVYAWETGVDGEADALEAGDGRKISLVLAAKPAKAGPAVPTAAAQAAAMQQSAAP